MQNAGDSAGASMPAAAFTPSRVDLMNYSANAGMIASSYPPSPTRGVQEVAGSSIEKVRNGEGVGVRVRNNSLGPVGLIAAEGSAFVVAPHRLHVQSSDGHEASSDVPSAILLEEAARRRGGTSSSIHNNESDLLKGGVTTGIEDGDGDGAEGLGGGMLRHTARSLSTQYSLSLDVMGTHHPARLAMQRSANRLLENCRADSPAAFAELLTALRGLEPVSMASAAEAATAAAASTRSRSHREASANKHSPRRSASAVLPSGSPRPPLPRPPTAGVSSSGRRTVSFHTEADGPRTSLPTPPPSRPLTAGCDGRKGNSSQRQQHAFSPRPTSATPLNVDAPSSSANEEEQRRALSSVHLRFRGDRNAIGEAPNKFFISSLPRDAGGHISALSHTVRPSTHGGAKKKQKTTSGVAGGDDGIFTAPPPPSSSSSSFHTMYSAYWEPLRADAPPLFDTAEQRVGSAAKYVFSDRQSASPFALQLTRAEQARSAQQNQQYPPHMAAASGGSVPAAGGVGGARIPRPPSASDGAANCAQAGGGVAPIAAVPEGISARWPPQRCGTSFTHARFVAERAASAGRVRGAAAMALSKSPRFEAPVPGELRPFFVLQREAEERQAAREAARAEAARKRIVEEGGAPTPKPARGGKSVVGTTSRAEWASVEAAANPFDRDALLVRGTVPDEATRPHVPAARFSSVPRISSFESTARRNFRARMPGPGAYNNGSALFGSSRHHRLRNVAACQNANIV